MNFRRSMVRTRLAAPIACSLIATILPFSAASAEYGIPAGSGAVITAGASLVVRAMPGWDAEVSYEIADGSYVTVWGAEQAAPDGSMWYPVDGGFVPVDMVTSAATLEGGVAPQLGDGGWVAPPPPAPALVPPAPPFVPPEPVAADDNQMAGGGAGDQVASFALRYQGYPYVYAGEGPYAFDCSGFTKFVIHHTLGLDIPHDMVVQYAMGDPVDRDALQPGDLVFFANTFRPGMSHNGVYIGGGRFVHAENEASGVKVSDLDAEYYRDRWYGAVRFS